MKLGCCLNMLAQSPPGIGAEHWELFGELGYDYVELPLAQMMELDEQSFQTLTERAGTMRIPMEVCNNFFPPSIKLTGPEVDLNKTLSYAKAALDKAKRMGAQVVVLGSAGAKNIPEGFSREKAGEQFTVLLRHLQEIAANLGITIVLEPLRRQESNFINLVREGHAIVSELKLKNIRVLADYYHMRSENESLDSLISAGADLRHCHMAALDGRVFPSSTDRDEDYAGFFSRLKKIGYTGRISVEAYSQNIAQDAAEALQTLRPLLSGL